MIQVKQRKEYVCSSCSATYPSMRGECRCGLWNTISEVEVQKKVYRLPKISLKRKAQNELPDTHQEELGKWFEMQRGLALTSGARCQNCGESIANDLNSKDTWIWRRVLAHVVQKSKYDSVKTHPLNILFLCWQCHSDFDSSWDKARKMNIWGLAIVKAKKLLPLITEATSKLPSEFVD